MPTNKPDCQRLYGEVLLIQPRIYTMYIFVVSILVIVGLVLLIFGNYAKITRVEGIITTTKGLTKIIATAPGIIEQQVFKGEDEISKGDVLYNILTKRQSNGIQDLDSDILVQLSTSKSLLVDKLDKRQKLIGLESKRYALEISEKEETLVHLLKEVGLMNERIMITSKALIKAEKLWSGGHLVESNYDDLKIRLLDTQINREKIEQRVSATQGDIAHLNYQLRVHPLLSDIELNELSQSLNQLEQQIIETSARRNYRIVSPVDGLVATNLTKIDEAVILGQTLMTILPTESLFMAELYVPSESIGFVKEGLQVSMRYSAFPYQHYGLYYGTVSDVSKVISRPDELNKLTNTTQSVYKVTVKLASQTVNVSEKQLPLNVGMTISASITLESRTLLQWVLAPIYSLRERL
jgi:membrane fusion protein